MRSDIAVGIKDRDAKKRIAATGSVIGAILASSCCIVPLVLVTRSQRRVDRQPDRAGAVQAALRHCHVCLSGFRLLAGLSQARSILRGRLVLCDPCV